MAGSRKLKRDQNKNNNYPPTISRKKLDQKEIFTPMISSGCQELLAVVATSSKLMVVFHFGLSEVVMMKLYSVSGSKLVMLIGGLL